jgi:glycerophosphoryl diester phosphodiesterase
VNKKIEIYAHRGGAGLRPETTLAAYRHALDLGVDVLDMDVGVTKDNIVVAYHDRALNRDYTRYLDGSSLPKGRLWIKDFTFEELQQFDVGILDKTSRYGKRFPDQMAIPGERIPSVEQVIDEATQIEAIKSVSKSKSKPIRVIRRVQLLLRHLQRCSQN